MLEIFGCSRNHSKKFPKYSQTSFSGIVHYQILHYTPSEDNKRSPVVRASSGVFKISLRLCCWPALHYKLQKAMDRYIFIPEANGDMITLFHILAKQGIYLKTIKNKIQPKCCLLSRMKVCWMFCYTSPVQHDLKICKFVNSLT